MGVQVGRPLAAGQHRHVMPCLEQPAGVDAADYPGAKKQDPAPAQPTRWRRESRHSLLLPVRRPVRPTAAELPSASDLLGPDAFHWFFRAVVPGRPRPVPRGVAGRVSCSRRYEQVQGTASLEGGAVGESFREGMPARPWSANSKEVEGLGSRGSSCGATDQARRPCQASTPSLAAGQASWSP